MRTEVVHVDATQPEATAIARAAEVLRRGGLVAFPTETVYGLGAAALDAAAVARIFAAKERPAINPIIVHVADAAAAQPIVSTWPAAADRLSAHFWPGPLTLVLPRSPAVPDVVTAGGPTVAVRVPAHSVALALLRASAIPVAAPSANRAGCLSATRGDHVLASLDGRIDLLLDGGPTPGGVESTVLDLGMKPPRLLRPGLVSPGQIEALIGPIGRPSDPSPTMDAPLPSPGLLQRHYAPRTPLECIAPGDHARVASLCQQIRVGWLALMGEDTPSLPGLIVTRMPRDPAAYASRLYAALHEMDAAGVDRIVVTLPPVADEWLMIHDRLHRAAAP